MLFDEVDDFFVSSAKDREFANYSPSAFDAPNQKSCDDLDDLVPGSPFSLGACAPSVAELDMLPLLELSPVSKSCQAMPFPLADPDMLEFAVPESSTLSTPSPLFLPPTSSPVLGCPVEVYPALYLKAPTLSISASSASSSTSSPSSSQSPSPLTVTPGFPVIPFAGLAFTEHCVPSETQSKPTVPVVAPTPTIQTTTAATSITRVPAALASSATSCASTPTSSLGSPREYFDEDTKAPGKARKRRAPALASVPDDELNADQLAKRMRRRQRNKESAQQSRQRKKQFVDELSDKVDLLVQDNTALRLQVRDVIAENELLKRTLHHHQIPIPRLPRPLFSQADQVTL